MKAFFEVEFDPKMMCDEETLATDYNNSWFALIEELYKEDGMGIFVREPLLVSVTDAETKEPQTQPTDHIAETSKKVSEPLNQPTDVPGELYKTPELIETGFTDGGQPTFEEILEKTTIQLPDGRWLSFEDLIAERERAARFDELASVQLEYGHHRATVFVEGKPMDIAERMIQLYLPDLESTSQEANADV